MPNIENLNFGVILDDKEFNQQIQKDIQAAKQLNTSLTNLLEIKKKIASAGLNNKSAQLQERSAKAALNEALGNERLAQAKAKTAAAEKRLEAATANAAAAQERLARASLSTDRAFRRTNNSMSKQVKMNSGLLSIATKYVSILGAANFVGSIVRITGEFEMQKTALAAMLGELTKAEEIFGNIKQLALESPFSFKELTSYAKQLTAFSVPAEELFETTRMLADVSAGLGVDMGRIILAFGQVKAAAFLRGQEVRQFTESGIPILEELAKQFEAVEKRAVSTGEVFDRISARQVPFEMVLKVFKDLTSEGGKFYNMQEVLSETLRGKVMKLQDAYQIMLNDIGESQSGILKGSVDVLTKMVQNWEKIGVVILSVVAAYGTYKAVAAGSWVIGQIQNLSRVIKYYQLLRTRVSGATAAMRAFNLASKSNVIGFITAAVIGLVTAIGSGIRAAGKLKRELNEAVNTEFLNAEKSVDSLTDLLDQLSKATQGTKEYSDIIAQINRQHGDHFENLLDEAAGYDEVAAAAGRAMESIKKKGIASAREAGYRKIEEEFLKNTADINMNEVYESLSKSTRLSPGGTINTKEWEDIIKLTEKAIEEYEDLDSLSNLWTVDGHVYELLEEQIKKYTGRTDSPGVDWGRRVKTYLEEYAKMVKAQRELDEDINARGDAEHFSKKERDTIKALEERYEKEREQIRKTYDEEKAKIELAELEEKRIQELIDTYKKLGRNDMVNYYESKLPKELKGWRKKVEDTIKKFGFKENDSAFGLWAKDSTVSVDYVDDMAKRYKELKEQIDTIPFDKEHQDRLKKEKKLIEDIANALGVNLEKLLAGKNTDNPEVEKLKNLVAELRKLQEQYEKLKALGVGNSAVQNLFKKIYPDMIAKHGNEFVLDLKYLERAKDIIKELSEIDPVEAEKLLFNLGGDDFGTFYNKLTDTISGIEQFYKAIRKWKTEDFNLSGTGITFELDKIASDLTSKKGDIDEKVQELKDSFSNIGLSYSNVTMVKNAFEKQFGEGTWEPFFEEYKKKGVEAIEELGNKEKEYERKKAQEKVVSLADNYVKDVTKNLNMTDWGDKSLYQIGQIQSALKELLSGDIIIDEGLKDRLGALGISLEDFEKAIESLLTGDYNETVTEKIKRIQETSKKTINIIGELGGSISHLGDAMGSDAVSSIGKYLSLAEDVVSAITDCESLWNTITENAKEATEGVEESADATKNLASSTDWVTMAIKLVLIVIEQVADAIGASRAAQVELNKVALEYSNIMHDIYNRDADGYFGENFRKKVAEDLRYVDDTRKNLENAFDDIAKIYNKKFYWDGNNAIRDFGLHDFLEGKGITYNDSDIVGIMSELSKHRQEILNATWNKSGFKLSARDKENFNTLLEYLDKYEEAVKSLKESVKLMFGSLADDIASNMIDAFVRAGDAAADLGKVFESLGESFLNSIISSWVLDKILTKYEDDALNILKSMTVEGNEDEVARELALLASNIKEDLGASGEFINRLAAIFQDNGLLRREGEEDTQSLADGIKGITEDTANLLASYLNAIRADVSYARTIWERMDATTQRIATILTQFSVPSLMEYQAQIAANTYNTMIATQSILSKLDAVVTYSDGPAGVRVYS